MDYLLSYYLPILPLWSGIILGPHSMSEGKVGKHYCHYSNAIIKNWMRIGKIDILQSKTNLKPGDFIKQLYPSIVSRKSAFKFAFTTELIKYFGVICELGKFQEKNVLKNGLGK